MGKTETEISICEPVEMLHLQVRGNPGASGLNGGIRAADSIQGQLVQCSTKSSRDIPGGAVVKNPPANAGDTGWSPGPGRSHMPRSN